MTGDSRSDRELLVGLSRQRELMGVLYERHARVVFRYLARRAGPSAAEDLVSEVFVTALSASPRVVAHDSGSALPWLYGIALNVLRAHFRRQPPRAGVARDLGMDWDAVDDRLDALAERGRLRTALDGLADCDRELLLLVAWEGLTSAEAAAVLGISPWRPGVAPTSSAGPASRCGPAARRSSSIRPAARSSTTPKADPR
jgi:RNA polymerase sigma-70 factor (ECF subfamily)